MKAIERNRIIVGDAGTELSRMPDSCVDMVMTSPPYFALWDYGVDGQIGHESDVQGWVDALVDIAREVDRILKPEGSFWLNVGDGYSRSPSYGAATRSLV